MGKRREVVVQSQADAKSSVRLFHDFNGLVSNVANAACKKLYTFSENNLRSLNGRLAFTRKIIRRLERVKFPPHQVRLGGALTIPSSSRPCPPETSCRCLWHTQNRPIPPSFWLSARRHRTAEAALIINLLARRLSRVVYTGATFRPGRSSSNSWSDSRRVASPERGCFHLFFGVLSQSRCDCPALFPSSVMISPSL